MKDKLKKRWRKLIYIFGIIGPGLITASAGNDAGGIATYATVGANYGYGLWFHVQLHSSCVNAIHGAPR